MDSSMTVDNVEPTIRSYRPSDLREVCRVWLASWRSTGVEVAVGTSENELRGRFAHGLDQGWSVTIAELGGSIVGFMAVRPSVVGCEDRRIVGGEAAGLQVLRSVPCDGGKSRKQRSARLA